MEIDCRGREVYGKGIWAKGMGIRGNSVKGRIRYETEGAQDNCHEVGCQGLGGSRYISALEVFEYWTKRMRFSV